MAFLGRMTVRNSCCGNHLGQQYMLLHQKAGHMDANDLIKTFAQPLQGRSRPHMGTRGAQR